MAELSADDTAAFGRAVTARRAELGLTRKEVAARSGLSYPYLSNIESGLKQPSAKALHALANALELRPAELLERSDSLARLAQSARTARTTDASEDGAPPRGSWFRGELAASAPATVPPDEDELRSLVREVVREELGHDRATLMPEASGIRPIITSRAASSPAAMASPPRVRPFRLPARIRAALPDWLAEPADSAVEIAIQSVVLEQLHRLPADTEPDEVLRTIDDALDHLIKHARRRRKPAQKRK